jgi:hypothetical protein
LTWPAAFRSDGGVKRAASMLSAVTAAALLFVACAKKKPPPVSDELCGMRTEDWCPSPPGDPCGAHKDTASCSADTRCEGRIYSGESVVACTPADRCFTSNCPTVGCLSRCETLDERACRENAPRCVVRADAGPDACARWSPCLPDAGAPAKPEGGRR